MKLDLNQIKQSPVYKANAEVRALFAKYEPELEALDGKELLEVHEKIRAKLREILNLPPPPTTNPNKAKKAKEYYLNTVEIPETMRKAIEANYKKQLKLWSDNGILEKGQTHYLADYDGSKEEEGKGKDFTGESFEIPTLKEVFEGLTERDVKHYMEWKRKGLIPELLLVPIGKTIRTLASETFRDKFLGVRVYAKVLDYNLVYEPESYDSSDPSKLVTTGGKRKSQLIKENKGWMIKISPLKRDLELIDTTGSPLPETEKTFAQKTAHWHREMNDMGLCGLDYETYIVAALATKLNLLELKSITTLPGVSMPDSSIVSTGLFVDAWFQIYLQSSDSGLAYANARCRPAVRVKRKS